MADIDRITDKNKKQEIAKLQLYGHYAPDLAAWGFQLYRGNSFSNYFKYFAANTKGFPKPLIVTEYGTDAYNDPCGWPETKETVCFNMPGDPKGGVLPKADGSFIGCSDPNLSNSLKNL